MIKSKMTFIFICILVFITTCEKEKSDNRAYDPEKSTSSIVPINTSEIGGIGLKLISSRDDDSPLSKGSFNTVVSIEGEQLLTITDKDNELRALTLSTPSSVGSNVMQVDAYSTSVTVVFISPGILSTDPTEAKNVINNIEKLNSFSPLESYVKSNLYTKCLKDLISTPSYDSLLSHCVEEYYKKYIFSNEDSTKGLQYSKNSISFNQISQKKIEIKNDGYRFVSVVERDINNQKNELNIKTHIPDMKGAIPFGWGSLFTNTMLDPTIEDIDYLPVTNSSYSEFWIFGMGLRNTEESVPPSIRALKKPVEETITYYVAFPIIDLAAGVTTLLKIGGPTFKEIMAKVKLANATYKTVTAKTKLGAQIALVDDTFTIIGIIASMSSSPVAVGTSYVLAGVTFAFSSFNFGAFAGSLLSLEDYTKFSVLAYNQSPMFPDLSTPSNNSENLKIPITFSWDASTLAESYDFQISKSPTFSTLNFEATGITSTSIQVNSLEKGGKYYWHVRSKNSYGTSLWSGSWIFTTLADNQPPNLSSSPSPADKTTGVSMATTLTWSCSDPDGDPLTYDVYFGTSNNPTIQIVTNLTTAGITRTGLSNGVTYYWRVVAKDNHANSTNSPIWSFTTAQALNNPPAIPSSPNPATAATGVSTSPTLSWSCSDPDAGDILTYDVYFGTTSNPTTTIATNQTALSIARTGLSNSTTYYWKVVAKDSKGATTSGPIWSFTTLPSSGTIPTDGLVAYYPFNGNANDQSGNNNNGTVYGATLTADRHGISNRAYLFDGIDNYIEINHSSSLNLSQQISISFWVKLETSADYYWPYHIIEKYECWGIGQREFDINGGIQTSVGYFNSFLLNFEADKFYHIVMTYNGSLLRSYVNGILIDSNSANGSIITNLNNIYIGKYTLGDGYFFDGTLDDIRIYNRALTDQEVSALYNE